MKYFQQELRPIIPQINTMQKLHYIPKFRHNPLRCFAATGCVTHYWHQSHHYENVVDAFDKLTNHNHNADIRCEANTPRGLSSSVLSPKQSS